MLSCRPAGSERQTQAGPDKTGVEPVEDEEFLALLRDVSGSGPEAHLRAMQALDRMEQERRVSGLAYALEQELYCDAALSVMGDRSRDWSKDRRLAPFLAQCIEDSTGSTLMRAVRAAEEMPDRALLPALIESALESQYVEWCMVGGEGGSAEFIYRSVFAEVAVALFEITDGEIGLESVRTDIPFDDDRRRKLIAEWKTWWAENKPEAGNADQG
jgi:hypothetical protein